MIDELTLIVFGFLMGMLFTWLLISAIMKAKAGTRRYKGFFT